MDTLSNLNPLLVLREAIKEVPAVKYALGAAGVAGAGAIIVKFLGHDRSAAITIGLTFLAMILLYTFSLLVKSSSKANYIPGIVLLT